MSRHQTYETSLFLHLLIAARKTDSTFSKQNPTGPTTFLCHHHHHHHHQARKPSKHGIGLRRRQFPGLGKRPIGLARLVLSLHQLRPARREPAGCVGLRKPVPLARTVRGSLPVVSPLCKARTRGERWRRRWKGTVPRCLHPTTRRTPLGHVGHFRLDALDADEVVRGGIKPGHQSPSAVHKRDYAWVRRDCRKKPLRVEWVERGRWESGIEGSWEQERGRKSARRDRERCGCAKQDAHNIDHAVTRSTDYHGINWSLPSAVAIRSNLRLQVPLDT